MYYRVDVNLRFRCKSTIELNLPKKNETTLVSISFVSKSLVSMPIVWCTIKWRVIKDKFPWLNLEQSLIYVVDLKLGDSEKCYGLWDIGGRWSATDKMKWSDTVLRDTAFENMLSFRALELLLALISWSTWGKNT